MDPVLETLLAQLATLYRARPFTKSIPFNVTFPGVGAVETAELWVPKNAYFELAAVVIRADAAGVDLTLVDTSPGASVLFVMPPTAEYQTINLNPGYRSLLYNGARLLAVDENASGVTIKGNLFGWEVTPDGYYR